LTEPALDALEARGTGAGPHNPSTCRATPSRKVFLETSRTFSNLLESRAAPRPIAQACSQLRVSRRRRNAEDPFRQLLESLSESLLPFPARLHGGKRGLEFDFGHSRMLPYLDIA
jgi:hypothetical protein